MFVGYKLTPQSRSEILAAHPPAHQWVRSGRIIERDDVKIATPPPPPPTDVQLVGYFNHCGVEGFTVQVDGRTERPERHWYYLVWSLYPGRTLRDNLFHVPHAIAMPAMQIQVTPFNSGAVRAAYNNEQARLGRLRAISRREKANHIISRNASDLEALIA